MLQSSSNVKISCYQHWNLKYWKAVFFQSRRKKSGCVTWKREKVISIYLFPQTICTGFQGYRTVDSISTSCNFSAILANPSGLLGIFLTGTLPWVLTSVHANSAHLQQWLGEISAASFFNAYPATAISTRSEFDLSLSWLEVAWIVMNRDFYIIGNIEHNIGATPSRDKNRGANRDKIWTKIQFRGRKKNAKKRDSPSVLVLPKK